MALKINKMGKEMPLHPNGLLAQIEELEGDCAKKSQNLDLSKQADSAKLKKKKPNILFDNPKETTLTRAYKMASDQ